MDKSVSLCCDNCAAVANANEPRFHKKIKHIDWKYHVIKDFVEGGHVTVCKIASEDNLADPFTKTLTRRVFERHVEAMGIQNLLYLLT